MEYPVVTLCGSTRFKDEFLQAQKELTLQGYIVLTVGLFGHSGDNEVWEDTDEGTQTKTKHMLDDMHLRKIDMSDEIFVINPGGYIGFSTRKEINYAKEHGKRVRYLDGTPITAIRSFAIKWIDIFENPEIDCSALSPQLATSDFHTLGFEMDSAEAFRNKYGCSTSDPQELEQFLKTEDDVFLIGATIYSFWRHLSYWMGGDREFLKPENRDCFLVYLRRLLFLTEAEYARTAFPDGTVWHAEDHFGEEV